MVTWLPGYRDGTGDERDGGGRDRVDSQQQPSATHCAWAQYMQTHTNPFFYGKICMTVLTELENPLVARTQYIPHPHFRDGKTPLPGWRSTFSI